MSDNPVAVVTGGSRGIGRAICLQLARDGYHLVVNYVHNEKAATETLEKLRAVGSDGRLLKLDVTDGAACKQALGDLFKQLEQVGPVEAESPQPKPE